MKLFTKTQESKMRANAQSQTTDHRPVVKLFNPCGSATWLLTELHEDNTAFGLCDLGLGFPEIGYVSIKDLKSLALCKYRANPMGLHIERDRHFVADKTLCEYNNIAQQARRIVA